MKYILYPLLFALLLVGCNGDDDDNLDPNQNAAESYLLIEGVKVPMTTNSVNFSDADRTIFQTNFQDNTHFFAFQYTVHLPVDATKNYTTTDDRFFWSNANVDDLMNLYANDFNNDINYISEAGKTVKAVKNNDDSYTITVDDLTLVEEVDGTTDISVSIQVSVKL
jgi:hypothetical protein